MLEIIVDTHEQTPWNFYSYNADITHFKVKTGDYTIKGLESLITIERKKSVTELAGNIVQKRFWAEMERMKSIRYKFLICEFSLSDINGYPYNLNLPQSTIDKIRIRPPFIRKKLHELHDIYSVGVILCENKYRAEEIAYHILRRVGGLYS